MASACSKQHSECGKIGHIAKVCRSGHQRTTSHTQQKSRRPFRAHNVTEGEEQGKPTYNLYHVESDRSEPVRVTVLLNQVEAAMEINTGDSVSIFSDVTYRALWADNARPTLCPSSTKIQTYTGDRIAVTGELPVTDSMVTKLNS